MSVQRGPLPRGLRWLGRVRYQDALALQRGLWSTGTDSWLLLLEHPHVYTLGVRAKDEHVLVPPQSVGAELVRSDRGGDVTYHGPGQLVGYPIVPVPMGTRAAPAHVCRIEQMIIDVLADLGLPGAGRLDGYPGVWVEPDGPNPRKICAVGVRVSRARSMHGFALNVAPDMSYFDHIVPCGIADKAVTSLAAEGIDVPMRQVVDAVVGRAAAVWGAAPVDRQRRGLAGGRGGYGAVHAGRRPRPPGPDARSAAGRGRRRPRRRGGASPSANRSGCG